MANEVGRLFVTLGLETSMYHKKLTAAEKAAERQAKAIQRDFENMAKPVVQAFALVSGAVLGATAAIEIMGNKFIEAASKSENYRLRLNILLRSQIEGNKMFKEMSTYAAKVPFTFDQIMESATSLSGVMKGGVSEIKKWMPMIGDLAAVSGLGISEVTQQVIRMYSAGAASADLFRERGILAMLGFKAGVTYSAEETKKIMWNAWTSVDSKFRGATDSLANTWGGLMSMFEDKWFIFRNMVMDNGILDRLKSYAKEMLNFLDAGKLQKWADIFSSKIITGFELLNQNREGIIAVFNAAAFASEAIMKSVSGWVMVLDTMAKLAKYQGNSSYNYSIGGRVGNQYVPKSTKNSSTNIGGYAPLNTALSSFSPWMLGWDTKANTWIKDTKQTADEAASSIESLSETTKEAKKAYDEWLKNLISGQRTDIAKTPVSFGTGRFSNQSSLQGKSAWSYGDKSGLNFMSSADVPDMHEQLDLLSSFNAQYSEFTSSIEEHSQQVQKMAEMWRSFGDTLSNVLANTLTQSGNVFQNIANAFKQMIEEMVAMAAARAAVFMLLNTISGGSFSLLQNGSHMSMADYVFGGFKANGGDVSANKPYVVGERGAELFIPQSAGKIVPNNQLTDNSSLVIHFNNSEKDEMSSMSDYALAQKFKRVIRNYGLQSNIKLQGAY